MRVTEWIRASQAILFEASILPAIVGTAASIHGGAPFQAVSLGLILLSLVGIQAGANLLKGYFEGRDRSSPSSPGSWFAFDSAAAVNLARDPRTVLRLGRLSFAIGIGAGLLLVLLPVPLVPVGVVWSFFGRGVLLILLTLAFCIAIVPAFPKEETASRFDRAIAWTVAAHALVGLAIVAALFFGL